VHPDGTGWAIPLETGGGFFSAFSPGWSPMEGGWCSGCSSIKTGQEGIYTARSDGTDLINVSDTADFEDSADWGPHPLAT
jgi:hypothetical protein